MGCGAGNYTLKLLERLPKLRVTLIDLSKPMLNRAVERIRSAKKGSIDAVQGDIREIDIGLQRYDIILAASVLHHLRDTSEWRSVFEKFYKSLRMGGSIWIFDLIKSSNPAVQSTMRRRYGEYLTHLKDEAYRDQVFAYVEKEDTPWSLMFQLELLRQVGFSLVDVLHKKLLFRRLRCSEGWRVNEPQTPRPPNPRRLCPAAARHHGVGHWARVLENGLRLAEATDAKVEVVQLFAIFHDARRVNDGHDDGHGERGADLAAELRHLFKLSDADFALLYEACAAHTDGLIEADVTIQVCWDSDRLDLGRVGMASKTPIVCDNIMPEPRTLHRCGQGFQMLKWADGRAAFEVVPDFVKGEWEIDLGG